MDSVKFEYHPLTEHWDGSAWHYVATVAPPKFAYFSSVGGSRTDDLWAVGSAENTTGTLAAHWDGTSWTEIDLPDLGLENAALTSVSAIAAKNVWAVGYNEAGDVTPLIAHWNGTAWRIVDNPTGRGVTELFGITALSGSDLWAVGERASRRTHVFREHYDGSAWSLG